MTNSIACTYEKLCLYFFVASISLPYDLTACIGVTHEKKILQISTMISIHFYVQSSSRKLVQKITLTNWVRGFLNSFNFCSKISYLNAWIFLTQCLLVWMIFFIMPDEYKKKKYPVFVSSVEQVGEGHLKIKT